MKTIHVMVGKYQDGHASCMLARSEMLPGAMRNGIREVSKLYTEPEHRGSGDASKLLCSICDEADTQGLLLLLCVEPYGDSAMDRDQLQAWYEKHGFMVIQAEPRLMARMVGATPRTLNPATAAVGRAIQEL